MNVKIDVSLSNQVTIHVPTVLFAEKFENNGKIITDKSWNCVVKVLYMVVPGVMEVSDIFDTDCEGKFQLGINHVDDCKVRFKVDGQYHQDYVTLTFPFVTGCSEICQNKRLRYAIKKRYLAFDDDDMGLPIKTQKLMEVSNEPEPEKLQQSRELCWEELSERIEMIGNRALLKPIFSFMQMSWEKSEPLMISGPPQSGKTTLISKISGAFEFELISFDCQNLNSIDAMKQELQVRIPKTGGRIFVHLFNFEHMTVDYFSRRQFTSMIQMKDLELSNPDKCFFVVETNNAPMSEELNFKSFIISGFTDEEKFSIAKEAFASRIARIGLSDGMLSTMVSSDKRNAGLSGIDGMLTNLESKLTIAGLQIGENLSEDAFSQHFQSKTHKFEKPERGQAIGIAVTGFEAELMLIRAKFTDLDYPQPLTIHGIVSEEAKAAIDIAFSVAADLEGYEQLRTRKVELQVGNLLGLQGTSIGLAALYAFVSLCGILQLKEFHAVTGFVDVEGGIHSVGGVMQKALAVSRHGLPLLLPITNKADYEQRDFTKELKPSFLSNVSQLLKVMKGDVNFVEEQIPSFFSLLD